MSAIALAVPEIAGAVKALPREEHTRLFDILASEDEAFQEYIEDLIDSATIRHITATETEWTPWEQVKSKCDALHGFAQ